MQVGDIVGGRSSFEEGLQIAQSLGDRLAETVVRFWLSWSLAFKGDIAAAPAELRETLVLAREFRHGLWISALLSVHAYVDTLAGDYRPADTALEEARTVALSLGNPIAHFEARAFLGYKEFAVGDIEAALRHIEEGIEVAREIRLAGALGQILGMHAEASLASGDRDAARALAEESVDLGRRTGYLWAIEMGQRCLARLALEGGDVQRAEDLEHEALQAAHRLDRRPGLVDSLEALARIASALESAIEATRLVAAAERVRGDIGYMRFPIYGPAHDELLARLRDRLGDEAFEAAWTEGSAMDLDAAVAYEERGRGERKRPSSGWASLTPVELDVVRLATEGLTNPRIAERMFITRATVKTHLAHVFTKLGIATRAELAAEATRRGI